MNKIKIMTPGPTEVDERVLKAMSQPITNPDLDRDFFDFYQSVCNKFKKLIKTNNDALILCGEGILGLESACASLIEKGDRVLCIENGIFGRGFGDFVDIYGGKKVYFHGNQRRGIDVNELRDFLETDNNFKIATLVHCETPSGITNNIKEICKLLNNYGIISVVDSVSAVAGEELNVDEWGIDVLLSGSQKCLSATPGLTLVSISDRAYSIMESRTQPIASFYCNLLLWKDWYNTGFPYTQPVTDIYGLNEALDIVLEDKEFKLRHRVLADGVRRAISGSGLELYPLDSYSNTVCSIIKPDEIDFNKLFDYILKEHRIMISGAFSTLENKVIRIGHMGVGCNEKTLYDTLYALRMGCEKQGFILNRKLEEDFKDIIKS